MESHSDLYFLLLAVRDHYLFSFGAVVLLVLAMVEKTKYKRLSNALVFWILAGMCVLSSLYGAWTDEHRNAAVLIAEKAQLTSQVQTLQRQLDRQLASIPVVVPESKNSLRQRTLKAADDVYDFLLKRQQNHPPNAYPDSRDPNPSDERKKAIKLCQDYDLATQNIYMRKYKDVLVGIVREYKGKGVNTATLESDLVQRVPYIALPGTVLEGSYYDDISRFRELAYHVDANDIPKLVHLVNRHDQIVSKDFAESFVKLFFAAGRKLGCMAGEKL